MQEIVPQSDEQSLQHFISNSPWNDGDVQDQIALEADELLGGHEDSSLMIDESGFQKKGKKSVGVARQWNGRQGKVDNCQVGVFAALVSGDKVQPVDKRLYLPKEWTNDTKRCREAGIPPDKIVFKTKPALALEMVAEARKRGMRFKWVGADGSAGTFLPSSITRDSTLYLSNYHFLCWQNGLDINAVFGHQSGMGR